MKTWTNSMKTKQYSVIKIQILLFLFQYVNYITKYISNKEWCLIIFGKLIISAYKYAPSVLIFSVIVIFLCYFLNSAKEPEATEVWALPDVSKTNQYKWSQKLRGLLWMRQFSHLSNLQGNHIGMVIQWHAVRTEFHENRAVNGYSIGVRVVNSGQTGSHIHVALWYISEESLKGNCYVTISSFQFPSLSLLSAIGNVSSDLR